MDITEYTFRDDGTLSWISNWSLLWYFVGIQTENGGESAQGYRVGYLRGSVHLSRMMAEVDEDLQLIDHTFSVLSYTESDLLPAVDFPELVSFFDFDPWVGDSGSGMS